MAEEKKNEEKDNCPLSPTDWVMFLSAEIFNEENKNNRDNTIPITTLLVATTLSIITLIFAVLNLPTNTSNNIISVLLLALFIFIFLIFIHIGILLSQFLARLLIPSKTQKRVEALKKLREKIVFGENDSNKIREEWKNI